VAEDGTCDQLVSAGDLTVTGLALQIVDVLALNRRGLTPLSSAPGF
jgi:hypothetical protein